MGDKNTVVVIDDESHVVNRIVLAFDWDIVNAEVVASFTDSQEALQKLPYLSPDIVISDIRMPVIDGLTLFEKLKGSCPYSKFIFLSGFNEFQLIKKALQLGAAAYCLKPVDDEELADTLLKTSKEIENEKLSMRYILESLISETDSSILPLFISKLNEIEYLTHHFMIICAIGDISEELRYYTKYISIQYDTYTFFYFVEDNGFIRTQGFQNRMDDMISSGKAKGFSSVDAELDATLGEKLQIVFSNAHSSFTGNIIGRSPSTSGFLKELKACSHDGDIERMLYLINDFEDEYSIEERNANEAVKIYNTAMGAIFHKHGQDFDDQISSPSELISEFSTLENMMHYLSKQLGECIAETAGLPISNLKSAVFKDIISFINKEYCSSITLQSISLRFSITPSYLCQMFQKELGMTFTKYITRLRIAKAARLLSDTNLPIASISDEVGFAQYYYFAKVFKKTMGTTPSEYRDRKANDQKAQ